MTMSPQPLAPEALAALSDFLRRIERRAAVLAELLCGSAVQGDAAVASAMFAFRNAAAQRPLADWDAQFWRLLLATAQLRQPCRDGRWPAPLAQLAAQGAGMRAVLLLRALAALDATQAAAVLGVTPDAFACALQRAMSRIDADSHVVLDAAMQQRLRQLPAARLVQLAAGRERALRGVLRPAARRQPAWRYPALVAGVVACMLAFAATFLVDDSGDGAHGAKPRPLPAAAPLATFDADFALMTHRDFEQLADPGDADLQRDLGFYAWYAARTAPATDMPGVPLQAAPSDMPAGVRHGAR
jgi:hypothetical protein